MNDQKIKNLIQIRKYIIECHDSLDGAGHPTSAMVKQSDVAHEYTQLVKMLDGLLKPYVNFN